MPVGEKERLQRLEYAKNNRLEGVVLTIPSEDALKLIEDDPLAQLPGEGDFWYSRFMHFIHIGTNYTIVGWHREHNKDRCTEKVTQDMSRMFLWMKRRIAHQMLHVEDAARRSRHQLYDTHVTQLRIADTYVERLLKNAETEQDTGKVQSMLKAATALQQGVLRNQADNQKDYTRFDVEMARLRAVETERAEDLD